jgi:energy-coupling factor transporter ATP-binding protein EcfA2
MRITNIKLRNFKRFTDLVVRDLPASAKLVVVVGPNGSGKSSLFDALLHWYRLKANMGINNDERYYRKNASEAFDWHQNVSVTLAGGGDPRKGSLYVRTAYRNDPDFAIGGISRPASPLDTVRVGRSIDNDQAVSDNYQRLVYDTLAGVYDVANDAKSVPELREELIGEIRASMIAVFGDLQLQNISDPLGSGTFSFDKGISKSFHYKNLSGGEKAAFDLLLDLHVKKKFHGDAVYCIDELETHLHTKVQGTLLRELVKVLPEDSQLWVTTHSLGVLRAAQTLSSENPGSVCVIDFDVINPDEPREIVPSNLDRVSWEKMISIALDDLSQRIAPEVVVVCEGSTMGNRRKDFDAEIYNRILGSRNSSVVFVSGGSSTQVAATGVSVQDTLGSLLPHTRIVSLCDRDDKSVEEVAGFEVVGGLVLNMRNLESFLFADDVIKALVVREQKEELLDEAIQIKMTAIANSIGRNNPPDDLKSAAGEIYTNLKRLLGLTRCGNSTDTFMRDTLAPLIEPSMPTYISMKNAVVDRLGLR